MKATQAKSMFPEFPVRREICVNCQNPVTYVYGRVDGGKAICSRFCDEKYEEKKHERTNALPEV